MASNASLVGATVLLVVLLAIFGYVTVAGMGARNSEDSNTVQMANPASVNCSRLGGVHEVRENPAGEAGYCRLPDGKVCEEWALFRDGSCTEPA